MMKETIGYYGQCWMTFMDAQFPYEAEALQEKGCFEDVAREVDRSANEYLELLNRQYAELNPPPENPEKYRSWKYTREFYTDGIVMRERVLVPHTRI